MPTNIQDQIKQFEAKRQASDARMNEIMQKAADEGRTLDSEETEEYDTLETEVKAVDSHLTRLKSLEAANVKKAARVVVNDDNGDPVQHAANLRGGQSIIQVERKLAPGIAFARFVGCMSIAKGSAYEALAFAKQRFSGDVALQNTLKLFTHMSAEMVAKAAVDVGTSTDTDWAAPLVQYQQMSQDFIEYLRPMSIIGRIPNLRPAPFNIRMPRQTGGGSAGWVGEGAPKPLTQFAFDNVTMRFTKLAAITVITEELARFSSPSAEGIIRDQLAKAVSQQMDADFVDPDNAGIADVKPASITYGVSPVASAGNSENDVRSDIQSVFAPWIAANLSPMNGVWIMSATTALSLSLMVNALGQPVFPGVTMNGGVLQGLPVIVSENAGMTDGSANGHIVILANAQEILLADDGAVTIDVSREASVQMDSAPDSPATASTVFRSLWQTNSIGIRAERYINWVKGRSQAVQYIASVNWGQNLS